MTVELLHELGSCGDYTRVFRRRFPTDQYPDGVEVNEEVCGQHAQDFSWSWAVDVLLNGDGANAWNTLYGKMMDEYNELNEQHRQNMGEWHERTGVHYRVDASREQQEEYDRLHEEHWARLAEAGFDTSSDVYMHTQARAFGRIFDQHPEYRSSKIDAARERAIARQEQEIIDRYASVEREIEHATSQIEQYERGLERLREETLPQLEARRAELYPQVAPAKARRAQAQAQLAAERAEEAAKRAQEAQEVAVKAQAEADALIADVEAMKTKTDEAGSASTEVAATATS